MATKVKSKSKLSEIIFYVCAALMIFSVFMFFMENLKWAQESSIAIPNFFDLMFGGYGSRTIPNWPIVGGMVVLFIFQIVLSTTCLIIALLLFFKKINKHTAICVLTGVAVLAVTCGILAFCSKLMIDRKTIIAYIGGVLPHEYSLKDAMKLNYGAYVYGITMITAAVGSLGAFILDHYNK